MRPRCPIVTLRTAGSGQRKRPFLRKRKHSRFSHCCYLQQPGPFRLLYRPPCLDRAGPGGERLSALLLQPVEVGGQRLFHQSCQSGPRRPVDVAARNHKRSDAQSRAVFSAQSLRRKGSSDARCLRLSARCLRRARDRGFRRKMRETQRGAG